MADLPRVIVMSLSHDHSMCMSLRCQSEFRDVGNDYDYLCPYCTV